MYLRGIRGATTASANTKEAIIAATEELLMEMINLNTLETENIASIFLSTTTDLNKEFPAVAARKIGLNETPLLCLHEMEVENALTKCIRILIHINTTKKQTEFKPVYLKNAISLRPDKALKND